MPPLRSGRSRPRRPSTSHWLTRRSRAEAQRLREDFESGGGDDVDLAVELEGPGLVGPKIDTGSPFAPGVTGSAEPTPVEPDRQSSQRQAASRFEDVHIEQTIVACDAGVVAHAAGYAQRREPRN